MAAAVRATPSPAPAARFSTKTMQLRDGRTLAYLQAGDLSSPQKVLWAHGTPSSGLEAKDLDVFAKDAGVCVMAPDRPGFGDSTPCPQRTILGWAKDVEELLNHEKWDKCAVAGWSGGGAYAAACAYALPKRVTKLGLVASVIPPDCPEFFSGIHVSERLQFHLAMKYPAVSQGLARVMKTVGSWAPSLMGSVMDWMLGPSGGQSLGRGVQEAVSAGLRDPASVTHEYVLLGNSWGFNLEKITCPMEIWYGDSDRLLDPGSWGPILQKKFGRGSDGVPRACLNKMSGQGHLLSGSSHDEIFQWLKDRTQKKPQ